MTSSASTIASKPSLIESGNLRFLIMDSPKESNLHLYLRECKKYNVIHLVRIAEPTYNKEEVEKAGITMHEMHFDDGASPPEHIISQWNELVSSLFGKPGRRIKSDPPPCIAVHCVAGLGRAPVLVAMALIEFGMDPVSAVLFIRERRRGAINAVQLSYLESYNPTMRKGKCCIM
mmetsp:Transcript_7183/g.7422  ORF Transcript_7183/g.7422 Transcript_7183/m.7422 type:complete len:175 (+) Transcript_7183:73-597(+)